MLHVDAQVRNFMQFETFSVEIIHIRVKQVMLSVCQFHLS